MKSNHSSSGQINCYFFKLSIIFFLIAFFMIASAWGFCQTIKIAGYDMEITGDRIYNQINFFTEKQSKVKQYQVEIRIDKRSIPFYKALEEIPDWWASFPGYEPAPVPEIAKKPMYSTWYNYHQNVSADALLKEAQIARKLGFKAIIVDDGWQTLDSSRGYAYTGDWQPERIPHMKEFVEALHKMDMKILLWYAVPFMGEKAKNFARFKGKYLRYWNGQGAYVLDPRYPEVREYIINTYKKALQEWNLVCGIMANLWKLQPYSF